MARLRETRQTTLDAEAVASACELCGRLQPLTWHHLIPRAVHRRRRYQRRYEKQEMHGRGMMICRHCHDGIHDLFPEKRLAEHYNTKEALLADPRLRKHIAWVRKQK
jgi:hypothetical protein